MKWFRSYHRAPFDPKWLTVALRAKCRVADVVAVWWALMDHASQQDDRGSIETFDAEEAAAFFQIDMAAVTAVMVALQDKGCTNGKRIVNWETYQRDETSTERVRKHRVKQDETVSQRSETTGNEITSVSVSLSESEQAQKLFDEWYAIYPRKQARGAALKAFRTALKKASFPELIAGVERYKRLKPAYADWMMPASWLNAERWKDEPDAAPTSQATPSAPPKSDREVWADLLARYKPGGFWPPNKGARPETGYCDAPADLLTDWQHRTGANAA
jgi:hypothetical protein